MYISFTAICESIHLPFQLITFIHISIRNKCNCVVSTRRQVHSVKKFFNFNSVTENSSCVFPGCGKKIPGSHSGNLMKHLQRHHKEQADVLRQEMARITITASTSARTKRKVSVLNGIALSAKSLKWACIRLITVNGRPLSLLNDSGFQDIVNPIIAALLPEKRFVVSSEAMRGLVISTAQEVREAISCEVKGRMLSLKVDATTKYDRSFLGVNIQFIKDGKVVLRTLAVTEMFVRHTGDNLRHEIIDILDSYDICVKQLYTYTSDTGANLLKAAELLKDSQEDEVEEILGGVEDSDIGDMECILTSEDFRLQSVRCAAHTLQLAVKDALKASPEAKDTIDAVHAVSRSLRTPNTLRLLKNQELLKPTLDVVTRWCSTHDMLVSVLALKGFIESFTNISLSEAEWTSVENIVASLAPVKAATKRLQEEALLLGDFCGVWLECKMKIGQKNTDLAQKITVAMTAREHAGDKRRGQQVLPSLFEY